MSEDDAVLAVVADMLEAVAGKPVTAHAADDWAAIVAGAFPGGEGSPVGAFTYVGGTDVWISPTLLGALTTLPVAGWPLHVVAHEAIHARGEADEERADAEALGWVTTLGERFYGVARGSPESTRLLDDAAAWLLTRGIGEIEFAA